MLKLTTSCALLAALIGPAAAVADTTVEVTSTGELAIAGTSAAEHVTVEAGTVAGNVRVRVPSTQVLSAGGAGTNCTAPALVSGTWRTECSPRAGVPLRSGVAHLEGGADIYTSTVAEFADYVEDGQGADTIKLGPGPDDLHADPTFNQSDVYWGEAGDDAIVYNTFSQLNGRVVGVTVNMGTGTAGTTGGGENDQIPGFEAVAGTEASDVVTGASTGTFASLYGGYDTFTGTGTGVDIVQGGDDPDTIQTGDGNDYVDAKDNWNDTVNCGAGTRDLVDADPQDNFNADNTNGCERRVPYFVDPARITMTGTAKVGVTIVAIMPAYTGSVPESVVATFFSCPAGSNVRVAAGCEQRQQSASLQYTPTEADAGRVIFLDLAIAIQGVGDERGSNPFGPIAALDAPGVAPPPPPPVVAATPPVIPKLPADLGRSLVKATFAKGPSPKADKAGPFTYFHAETKHGTVKVAQPCLDGYGSKFAPCSAKVSATITGKDKDGKRQTVKLKQKTATAPEGKVLATKLSPSKQQLREIKTLSSLKEKVRVEIKKGDTSGKDVYDRKLK